jgi:uncharacterized protein YkwD
MRSIIVRRFGRLAPAVFTALIAVSLPSSAQAAACVDRDRAAAELSTPAVRATTLCLVNAKRRANGLRPLHLGKKLGRAAGRHSRDRVAHRYFAHNSRSGATFATRIARTGWMHGRSSWVIGENLAWGGGPRSTPRSIVASWMASPDHRSNILHSRYHEIGIGVASGVPIAGGGSGATFTTDFGS